MKRLDRTTQRILAVALALAFAVFGIMLLAGDESPFEAAVTPRGGDVSRVQAPRVTFDDGPQAAAVGSATPVPASAKPGPSDPDHDPQPAERDAADDTRPGLLTGRVVDRQGNGLFGASVELVRMQRRARPERTQVKTDARGHFSVQSKPGRYWITAEHDGFAQSEGRRLQLEPAGARTVELVLPPSSALVGTVLTADGRPLAGARVSLDRRDDESETQTDADGAFRMDGLREGLYRVSASHDGYVRETARNVPVVEGSGGQVTLILKVGGELTGVLRRPDGAPLARGLLFGHREQGRPAMTRSDDTGQFRLTGLEPGPLTLFARSEDYGLSVRTAVDVAAGTVAVHDLVLAEGPRLEGVLRKASGEPLADAFVVARGRVGDVVRRGKSDTKGHYTIKNLYPGRYEVHVSADRRSRRAPLVTREVEVASGSATLDLTVPEPIVVAGVVVDDTGTPVKDANLFALVGDDTRGQARSKDDGSFRFDSLPADSYRLFVRVGNDRLVGLGAAELREGEVLEDLELVVRPPAQLSGRVLDAAGQPVAGVVIDVRGGGAVRREATTDAEGRYALGPLYDGEYELEAREGSLALVARRLQVERLSLDPIRFAVNQGQSVTRDLVVR